MSTGALCSTPACREKRNPSIPPVLVFHSCGKGSPHPFHPHRCTYVFIKLIKTVPESWESLKKADDELLINSLSILCPFENDEKQALLEAKTIKERVKILTTLMEMSIKAETTFGPLQ